MNSKYNRFNSLKVLSHYDKLQDIAKGNIPSPVTWMIYPSNYCNLKCGHCIMKDERQEHQAMLPDMTLMGLADDLALHRIPTIIFSGGGEPCTHPKLADALFNIKRWVPEVKTGMNTNGTLLTKDIVDNLDFCRVSLDAHTKEIYEQVKGVDRFDAVVANLALFKDSKCELGIAYLATPENIAHTAQFCEWAQQFNPDFIHVRPAHYPDNRMVEYGWVFESLKPTLEAKYDNVHVTAEKFEGYWTPKLYKKCRSTPLMAVTTADGQFAVCQDVFIKWGDYNAYTFEQMWWSEEHKRAMDSICLDTCPRCVENTYNEIIEHCVMNDGLKRNLL